MHNLMKNKKGLIAVSIVFAIALFSFVLYESSFSQVNLTVNDETRTIKTRSKTLEDFIKENDIYVGKEDYINLNKDDILENGTEVIIKHSAPVTIKIGNKSIIRKTYESKVKDILNSLHIEYDMDDVINPGLDSTYEEDMVISLTRVEKKEVVEEEKLEYNTVYKDNGNLEIGKTKTLQEGSEGVKEIVKSQVFENGELIEEEIVKENIVKEPTNKVIEKGTKPKMVASRGRTKSSNSSSKPNSSSSSKVQSGKTITMSASAYSTKGNTATGVPSGPGKVAVDPSVIPLGTKLYIESLDGWNDYGHAVAADTGGAIRGNKIDLFYSDRGTALRFGRRKVKVHILK